MQVVVGHQLLPPVFYFPRRLPEDENNARFDVTFEQCWPAGMELRID